MRILNVLGLYHFDPQRLLRLQTALRCSSRINRRDTVAIATCHARLLARTALGVAVSISPRSSSM